MGLFTAATSRSTGKQLHDTIAPLLPKLRGYFAEFLNRGSLERLGILTLTTCVGLRYGHDCSLLEAFLDSRGSMNPPTKFRGPYESRRCK